MRISGSTFCRVAGVAALAACAVPDPFVPTVDNMVGAYTATQLVTADANGYVDWIAAGGSLTLTLNANATTTGRLFLPGGATGGGDLDEDMVGTWLLIGQTIQLGQAAQTFVRQMDFIAEENRLAGDKYFGTAPDTLRVIIILTK
jgi:hypothetical protein